MHKGFIKTAVILAAITVLTGAFAAHLLKGKIGDHALETFETAVRYQFYHVFALLITGILYQQFKNSFTIWAGRLFIAGILLFCLSLYVLAFAQATVQPGYKWIGAVTPFGGLAFIAGWTFLFISCFKRTHIKPS